MSRWEAITDEESVFKSDLLDSWYVVNIHDADMCKRCDHFVTRTPVLSYAVDFESDGEVLIRRTFEGDGRPFDGGSNAPGCSDCGFQHGSSYKISYEWTTLQPGEELTLANILALPVTERAAGFHAAFGETS